MKKMMIPMLILALAALAVAQGDHVPAYRDPAPVRQSADADLAG